MIPNGLIRFLFLVVAISFSITGNGQTILLDNFNRTNSTVVGNSWNETETAANTGAQVSSNQLVLASSTAGRDYIWQNVSASYNTVLGTNSGTLTWMFNMRQSRTDPSGFDASNYGVAFILGASNSNFTSGSTGYAVVLGNSGTSDNLRLVRFSNGVGANASLTNIISPAVDYASEYLAVKVTYNPVGNSWSLYSQLGVSAFTDPALATFTQIGTSVSDNTYTGVDLMFVGCLWNHATSGTDNAFFDNIYIPSACIPSAEPTVQSTTLSTSSVGANSVTLNWTRGNGSQCVIIGCQGGSVTSSPTDGAAYAANPVFGSGTSLAPNEYVVYSGSGTSVTVTSLLSNTSYQFKVFEFNGAGCGTNYLVTSPAVTTVTTTGCLLATSPTIAASSLSTSSVQSNAMTLSWTRGNGAACLIVCRGFSPVISPPADGNVYTANPAYGLGSTTAPGEYVVYQGTGSSVTVTGLMPNTAYYFAVFELNGSGCNTNYLVPGTLTAANATTGVVGAYTDYFGNLHSHSAYSDGDQDALCPTVGSSATCCYNIANTAINFDFMGIADHNHNEGPAMTRAKYASGVSECAAYNASHTDFVALYGMEWGTISTGGHATVYGIDQLVGWNAGNYDIFVAKGDYNSLFSLVAATPGAFSTLCHPGTSDYGNLTSIAYNATYDNAIIGTSVQNGDAFDSTYVYADPPTNTTYTTYYRTLLAKGYHLGPTADMDNHYSKTMGKSNQGRTVVLATARTKAAITEALLAMRFYATEDYNMQVTYTVNNAFPMGSIVAQTINPTLYVSATDADGETITSIKIYFGVPGSNVAPTVLASTTSSSITYTHAFASGTYYYYAEILQADGGIAWTAPVWYTKITTPLPIELLSFTGERKDAGNELRWTTLSEINNEYFTLERSEDGILFKEIVRIPGAGTTTERNDYMFMDEFAPKGINYYRLKQTDFDGTETYSDIVVIRNPENSGLFTVYPNPSEGTFTLSFSGATWNSYQLRVYNALGETVWYSFESGNSSREIILSGAPAGVYTLDVTMNGRTYTRKLVIFRP